MVIYKLFEHSVLSKFMLRVFKIPQYVYLHSTMRLKKQGKMFFSFPSDMIRQTILLDHPTP